MSYIRNSKSAAAIMATLSLLGFPRLAAMAQQAQPVITPDAVKQPTGINLGGTSFFDGIGSVIPGFVLVNYGRYSALNGIIDGDGNRVAAFDKPRIEALSEVLQPIWVSPLRIYGGVFGADALIPVTSLNSSFKPMGAPLSDNNFNLSDTTLGVFYQHKLIVVAGHPVLAWRLEIDAISPTGAFDSSKDLNQGSGFWSLNPYWSVTALPTRRLEISARFNYLYNFETDKIAHAPPIPGLDLRNGQAGQSAWINFASSYELLPGFRPGINGFYFKQFTQDRTNGMRLDSTLAEQLFVGPGVSISFDRENSLNLNVYVPISVRNSASGPAFNYQFVHFF